MSKYMDMARDLGAKDWVTVIGVNLLGGVLIHAAALGGLFFKLRNTFKSTK